MKISQTSVVSVKNKRTSSKKNMLIDNFQLLLLTMPGFILTFIFCYIPMFGVIVAFKTFNPNLGILGSEWVGLDNFKFFFTSNDFVRLIRNTVLYGIDFLVVDNVFAIIFAILIYNIGKNFAIKYYQTTAILPSFMSIVLISYIVYAMLNPTSGVLNKFIVAFGGEEIDWYSVPGYWPGILTTVQIWKGIGMGSLLYYATMIGIDEALFDAAKIDGANKWHEIRCIILPSLGPLICMNIILGVGGLMGGDFGLFYQLPRNSGLLYPTTDIINTYTFRALQTGSSMGRTAAVGLFGSVCGVILIILSNAVIKKIDPEKSLF